MSEATYTTSADESIETGTCKYQSPYSTTCNQPIEVLVRDDLFADDETFTIGRCRKHTRGYVIFHTV